MKKDSVKIVTIGGGSSYTPELVEGFIKRYDTLPVRELWLVILKQDVRNWKLSVLSPNVWLQKPAFL